MINQKKYSYLIAKKNQFLIKLSKKVLNLLYKLATQRCHVNVIVDWGYGNIFKLPYPILDFLRIANNAWLKIEKSQKLSYQWYARFNSSGLSSFDKKIPAQSFDPV